MRGTRRAELIAVFGVPILGAVIYALALLVRWLAR
jgi:hypothetical protein